VSSQMERIGLALRRHPFPIQVEIGKSPMSCTQGVTDPDRHIKKNVLLSRKKRRRPHHGPTPRKGKAKTHGVFDTGGRDNGSEKGLIIFSKERCLMNQTGVF